MCYSRRPSPNHDTPILHCHPLGRSHPRFPRAASWSRPLVAAALCRLFKPKRGSCSSSGRAAAASTRACRDTTTRLKRRVFESVQTGRVRQEGRKKRRRRRERTKRAKSRNRAPNRMRTGGSTCYTCVGQARDASSRPRESRAERASRAELS